MEDIVLCSAIDDQTVSYPAPHSKQFDLKDRCTTPSYSEIKMTLG